MSGRPNTLLIDVGNTRTKSAWRLSDTDISPVSVATAPEDLIHTIKNAERVVLSCVGHDDWLQAIELACEAAQCELVIAQVTAMHNGLACAYTNTSTLGVDRWLAILAMHTRTQKPFAVVQLGTALTCDVVANNVHQGGWISPGYQLMRKAVTANTAKVFTDDAVPQKSALGESTPECVNLGCLAACNGFVQQASDWMNKHFDDFHLYISGGDADLVDIKELSLQSIEHIVLRGLAVY